MRLVLVRHAAAVARHSWPGDDAGRPLDERGRLQAAGLVGTLSAFGIAGLRSSPAVRCVATLEPLAAAVAVPLETADELFEGNGRHAIALVASLLDGHGGPPPGGGDSVVLCSHGDVIPEVLEWFEAAGADLGSDRRCQKGSTWILERRRGGTVVGRYLPPPA